MGKETQLLEAASAGNNSKVEVNEFATLSYLVASLLLYVL